MIKIKTLKEVIECDYEVDKHVYTYDEDGDNKYYTMYTFEEGTANRKTLEIIFFKDEIWIETEIKTEALYEEYIEYNLKNKITREEFIIAYEKAVKMLMEMLNED